MIEGLNNTSSLLVVANLNLLHFEDVLVDLSVPAKDMLELWMVVLLICLRYAAMDNSPRV
jgi:hypothetical protein